MIALLEQEELVSIERAIPMRRVWAMPNKNTFNIPPIRALVRRYLDASKVSVDPFARNKRWATYTNDLNPDTAAEFHMEATEFLGSLLHGVSETGDDIRADLVLFDPPYSLTQVSRSYQDIGLKFQGSENPTGGFPCAKDIIARLLIPHGFVISCGWNTVGMGVERGFQITEILIVCHGGNRNDTIVTVERKVKSGQAALAFNVPATQRITT